MLPIKVLFVDESEDDTLQLTLALSAGGYDLTATRVDTPETLLTALENDSWDIVIGEYHTGVLSGARALTIVREHSRELPFIFASTAPGEDAAVNAMRSGAQDYISKSNLARLPPAVERALRELTQRRERLREIERVAYLAYHDELTDLPNRTLLRDRLQQAIVEARRESRPLALLVLDLDGFKEANDTLGHHAGDRVLQTVARRLRGTLRESDTVARLGGDEFALLLKQTDVAGAELAAQKVLQELELPMFIDHRPLFIYASMGIAVFPDHSTNEQELLHKADAAMYIAKSDRSGHAVYSPTRHGRAEQRLALVSAMWQGLEHGEFSLEYQPIVDLRTERITALEAALRWNHPQHSQLAPRQFMQLAERSGLITPLTLFAINRAVTEWPDNVMTVAVNVSARTLHDVTFPAQVRDLLTARRIDGSCLALEITENVIMTDPERSVRCLNELHAMGIKLVMNAFGTGYSSLSLLRRLPVKQLKIDQSFVAHLGHSDDEALVRSIIDLAHNLGLEVVADGVQSQAACDRLQALGCDAAQGPFISEPASAARIAPRLTPIRDRSQRESA